MCDVKLPGMHKTDFQSGRTFTLATDKWAGQAKSTGQDLLRQWLLITVQGRQKRQITFITANQVCKNTLATAGPSTCWMQQ
eukprot:6934858-Ditylum_brightwellii.AAC.1